MDVKKLGVVKRCRCWLGLFGYCLAVSSSLACGVERVASDRSDDTILVSVAASLSGAVDQVAKEFKRETGVRVVVNTAGSQILATQIVEGAQVDVFVSADERQMFRTVSAGRIDGSRLVNLLSNQLVIVMPSDRESRISDVEALADPSIRRIALGDPEAVPVGVYSKQYLVSVDLWDAVAPKVIPTRSARAVLRAVESGSVDAGFVYRTDAMSSQEAVVVYDVESNLGPRIVYLAAVTTNAPNPSGAVQFFDFIQRSAAQQLFERLGFVLLTQPVA